VQFIISFAISFQSVDFFVLCFFPLLFFYLRAITFLFAPQVTLYSAKQSNFNAVTLARLTSAQTVFLPQSSKHLPQASSFTRTATF
jgi:hypothetical protein